MTESQANTAPSADNTTAEEAVEKTAKTTTKAARKTTSRAASAAKSAASTELSAFADAQSNYFESFSSSFEDFRQQLSTFAEDYQARIADFQKSATEASEAMKESAEAMRDAANDFNTDTIEYFQTETNRAIEFTNNAFSAKTVHDLFELQQTFWSEFLEEGLEHAREVNQRSLETARRSFEPLTTQMNSAIEKAQEWRPTWAISR